MARDLNDPTQGLVPAQPRGITLPNGMVVGGYRVEGILGSGGMGQVYAAVHPVIGKRVAIKVLLPGLSRDADVVERFITEARAVNEIGHPNIVDIFAFGQLDDGRHFMVMDYLAGESLRTRLGRGAPPVREAVAIIDDVASALVAAHAQGIVHRDLKPDNVFLVALPGGGTQVKLLDFGIAKLIGRQQVVQTQSGAVMGTPAYMAPEQGRGTAVDQRADVYALGVMLFELLTGDLPFAGDNYFDLIVAHDTLVPPVASTLMPGLPRELDTLVAAMMSKAPAARPTLGAIRAVFKRLLKQLAPPPSAAYPVSQPPLAPTARVIATGTPTIGPDADTLRPVPASSVRRDRAGGGAADATTRRGHVPPVAVAAEDPASRPPALTPVERRTPAGRRIGIGVGVALIIAGGVGLAWYVVAHRTPARRAPVVAPADAAPAVAPVPAPIVQPAPAPAPDPVIDAAPATAGSTDAPRGTPRTRGKDHGPHPDSGSGSGRKSGSADCDPMRTLGGC